MRANAVAHLMRPGLTLSSVVACLVFSAVALLPFEPWGRSGASGYAFEIQARADHSGLVQLYYDLGQGMNEHDSALQPIVAGHDTRLRFALPSGRYQALRFDPLDRDARVTLSGARIVDGRGRTVVAFTPAQFAPGSQVRLLTARDGDLLVETEPEATDPQLGIRLADAFTVPRPPLAAAYARALVAMLSVVALLGWAIRSPSVRLGARVRSLWETACASPGRTLALAALAGTLAANYPVAFAGKSLVSPGLNVALLYGQSPWLPGFQGSEAGDAHQADVVALLWHHVPLSAIEHRAALGDRELPLWNRYDSAGVPLLGQGQSCFGDPLHVIPLLAGGAAWSWDLKFLMAKWAFALGVGLCAWRAFRHLPSSLLMSVSASFLGFYVYRINHPAIFSLCYSPWIVYAWIRCAEARSIRGAALWLAALMGANWVEMNSGTAKEAYILLLSMNFSGLCILLLCARPVRERLALLGGSAAAGVLFAMISSPVWYTFLHALRGSYTSYQAPLAFQIQPGMLIGLFDEAFYRPFQLGSGVVDPSANFFVLLGLLWAAVRWRMLWSERTASALLVSSLPALALAYGVVPPGVIGRMPLLGNILHVDNTFSCALIVIFSVLSAFGWRQAWESLGSGSGKRDLPAVMALLALVFAAYLGTAQAVVRSYYFESTWGKMVHLDAFIWGYGASLLLASGVLLWALRRGLSGRTFTPALFLCALFAFGAFHWREALQLGPAFADYVVRPTGRTDFRADSPAVDAIVARQSEPSRVVGFHDDLLPGWSGVYGLEGISGPDALINPYYRDLMDAAGVKRIWDWRYIVEPRGVPALKAVLDALGVRFYAGYHLGAERPGAELLAVHSSDMDVFESRSAWPRAFFTDSVAVYGDLAQYVSWLRSGDGRPFAAIERGEWGRLSPVPRVSGDLSSRTVTPARDYGLTANTTSFTVAAAGPGFIVLTEAYERGNFQVTVNGRRSPYIRVNHAFKAVYVDAAGTYRVTFAYWPSGLTTTLVLSACGLAAALAALALALFSGGRRGFAGNLAARG